MTKKITNKEYFDVFVSLQTELFFLFISIKLRMTIDEAKHHLHSIKLKYDKDEKFISNLSPLLRNSFYSYQHFLLIINHHVDFYQD